MTANPLTSKHLAGSRVSDTPPIYEDLGVMRKPYGPPFYIQGHLLNKELGGLGLRFNLTPLRTSANGDHERKVEGKINKWLINTKVKAVYYQVEVGGYGRQTPFDPARLDTLEDKEKKGSLSAKETVELSARRAEKRLVRKIVCTAHVLENDGSGVWKKATKPPTGLDSHPISGKEIEND